MEFSGIQCSGCGSTNVSFDPKKRMLTCNQCGKEEYYSRATLNASGKVLLSKDNAMRFFAERKFESAQHYAYKILDISQDNAPALFIIAYYDEFVLKKNNAVADFFRNIKSVALEYKEVRELMRLFELSIYSISDYEKEMIELIALNMQSDDDKEELASFIDKVCPYIILKRPSIAFLNKNMAEIYGDLAEHCNIPKTCFALIKSIKENPDSPFGNDTFYLKARTEYYYNNFVKPIGTIISRMSSSELKSKFLGAYDALNNEYISRFNG